ncbi:transcriptional regulator family: Fungal Specific TF [Penicillium paradoxum]|uniref:transcriptional regulator family: Fungal Specific TF n=1 Tax=Penicillium paradoxum TaxID=176176 RepID=UPI002547C4D6|nr:transcriptional regulator family: Fungal Specific TF [Penicillium paradoxum]KAJ5788432.1 transcriptional regulator family: Fungal Specific TF [Penicillium paradoxum]
MHIAHAASARRKKVKTGCKTCKIRRVKCDEGRPACRKCVSTSRVCDGYGIWGGGGSPYDQPQCNRALSVYCTPVPVGNLSQEEQVCFDWLIKRTTKKFSGLFPSDFWQTLVFQASAQEPAVRHALIAVSSAHRFDYQHGPDSLAENKLKDERFTLQQYNKAIRHLRRNTTDNNHSVRVALITCLLFIILEYMRGQYEAGSEHLQYGIKLLCSISKSNPPSPMTPTILCPGKDFAYNALVDAYARLGTQSAMFGHSSSHIYLITQDPQATTLPNVFSSLEEARRSLDDLLNRVQCLTKHYYDYHTPNPPTSNQKTIQNEILADLSLWRKTYTLSITLEADKTFEKERFSCSLLQMYHEMATIKASVCLHPTGENESEMIFDAYTENFLAIMTDFLNGWKNWAATSLREEDIPKLISQSDELKTIFRNFNTMSDMNEILENSLLDILKQPSACSYLLQMPECGGNGFTVEAGYIPPIYYTALKCRVPRIRRQAVKALRAVPHREGAWNGPILADVLEEVIAVEEGEFYTGDVGVNSSVGYVLPKPEELVVPKVPAEARVSNVRVLLPDHVAGHTYISYRKRVRGEWVALKRKVGG